MRDPLDAALALLSHHLIIILEPVLHRPVRDAVLELALEGSRLDDLAQSRRFDLLVRVELAESDDVLPGIAIVLARLVLRLWLYDHHGSPRATVERGATRRGRLGGCAPLMPRKVKRRDCLLADTLGRRRPLMHRP